MAETSIQSLDWINDAQLPAVNMMAIWPRGGNMDIKPLFAISTFIVYLRYTGIYMMRTT